MKSRASSTEWGPLQIPNSFSDVCVDALVAIADAARAEHLRPDTFDVVGTNGIGEDGMQVFYPCWR